MEGTFGQIVRLGVETALGRFVDDLAGEPPDVDTYVNLGRGEFHAGRSLESLLAAYRIGARVTWRRFVEAGTAGGLAPAELYDIGEAIFAYIDVLSSESADGYAREQRAEAGERRQTRARLVEALATGAEIPADCALGDAAGARELSWSPSTNGIDRGSRDRFAREIGPGVVAAARDGVVCAVRRRSGRARAAGERSRPPSGALRCVIGPANCASRRRPEPERRAGGAAARPAGTHRGERLPAPRSS